MKKRIVVPAVALLALLLGLMLAPFSADAARMITGHDIKDNSLTSRDVHDNTLKSRDVRNNSLTGKDIKNGTITDADIAPGTVVAGEVGPQGPAGNDGRDGNDGKDGTNGVGTPGPQGPAGPAGSAFTYQGANWSLVDRNVIGNAYAMLRPGPSSGTDVRPPLGIGSLGIHTGSNTDKAVFGNQVDYVGNPLTSITTVKYDVFTTQENRDLNVSNLPGVSFEIDPTGPATSGAGGNYSTLVYVPVAAPANVWSTQDATTADQWFLTGNNPGQAGAVSGCNQTASSGNPNGYCTLDEVKAFFSNASLLDVQITKGRDYAFTGAVDKLVLGNQTFDFEPNGVRQVN